MTKEDVNVRREAMINQLLRENSIRSTAVLDAMKRVPREAFLPEELREFAYNNTPLPIAAGQTISQPTIVAMMTEALELKGGEKVLDVGTGSGYAAAVLACIAEKVYSIERIDKLATQAKKVLQLEGFMNVELRVGDGSLGWPEAALFDGIVVAAGAPAVPEALKQQLAIGGRLVLPVGAEQSVQQLLRITRLSADKYKTENLGDVRFVPLIGEAGFNPDSEISDEQRLIERIAQVAEPFDLVDDLPLEALLERVADSKVLLLGEASHGSSEFYRARHRITRALIEEQGFNFVALEGDWPDVASMNRYLQSTEDCLAKWINSARFPTWMWRNEDVLAFMEWLREYNKDRDPETKVAFYGLDMYSLFDSIAAVLSYLDDIDPEAAKVAREQYAALEAFKPDPFNYSEYATDTDFVSSETAVAKVLQNLQALQHTYIEQAGRERFLDALQNARLVVSAEAYYRLMHQDTHNLWNLRDTHMFETLEALLAHHGEGSRGVVWAHNSHIGDARATESLQSGELNLGQLCRERWGDAAYLIGFGTNQGTVAAASRWGEPMEKKTLRPVLTESYEWLFHKTGLPGFLLPFSHAGDLEVRRGLLESRLHRAIGVVYLPETERSSHYFEVALSYQFDEYIWIDHTQAVTPRRSGPWPR